MILTLLCPSLVGQANNNPLAPGEMDSEFTGLFQVREDSASTSVRVLTGFHIKGRQGIYTCLHGVIEAAVDSDKYQIHVLWQADRNNTAILMNVAEVDIRKDLAFLTPVSSKQWNDAISSTGSVIYDFQPVAHIAGRIHNGDKIFYAGNPSQSGFVESKEGIARKTSNNEISAYASAAGFSNLGLRESPALDQFVIPFTGSVTKGESGSIVLLSDKVSVVGFVDGGLSEMDNWAIPIDQDTFEGPDVTFQSVEDARQRLREIQKHDVPSLTSLDNLTNAACELAFSENGLRPGVSEKFVDDCIRQSLRVSVVGLKRPLALEDFNHRNQFYLWLEFPSKARADIKDAVYSIETITDHGPGALGRLLGHFSRKEHLLDSCNSYRGALVAPKIGLVPWLGQRWDKGMMASVVVTIDDRKFEVNDFGFEDLQFDRLPISAHEYTQKDDCD